MKRVVLADTGPLYAAVDPDDQYHGRAQRELKRLSRDRRAVVVVYPILLESYTLVLYRLGKQAALTWLTVHRARPALVGRTSEFRMTVPVPGINHVGPHPFLRRIRDNH
jgi:hypothetical protein